ncbi:MAG: LamG-like jellyroll fold domain-containing protein [Saprospiraceae bacterium]
MKKILPFLLFTFSVISILYGQNNALHFDGNNDLIIGPSNSAFELETGTVELWVKPENALNSQTFICYRSTDGSQTRYLWNFLGGLSGLGFWNGSGYLTISHSFTSGQWYHLAFVIDGLLTTVYVDGVSIGTFGQGAGTASGSDLYLVIGNDIPLAEYFNGEIDEVRIWSHPLSQQDIQSQMNCNLSGSEQCLVAYYKFDEGNASGNNAGVVNLSDETSNNLDGTLNNFSLIGNTSNWVNSNTGVTGNCLNGNICLLLSITIESSHTTLHPTWAITPTVTGTYGNGNSGIQGEDVTWSSSNPSVASVSSNGKVTALTSGNTTITGTISGISDNIIITVVDPVLAPVYETIDPYLSSSATNGINEIPVVILRYMPSADGLNLDVSKAPDFYTLNPISLPDLTTRIDAFDQRVKFSLVEGTKFRGYNNSTAVPFIGYKVVEYITVYENTPPGPIGYYDINDFPVYLADYFSIFSRFNLGDYITNQGVKEIWIWDVGFDSGYPSYDPNIHDPEDFRTSWESNMSSPTTGDISNSNRDNNDLPVLGSTYILYHQNFRRSQAEAVHNRGHQIEHMFTHVNYIQDGNNELFWKKFVGQDGSGQPTTGRCGWTHMPPNTTTNYDYTNTTVVDSDIEDWKPDGSGQTTSVSKSTWENLNYSWPGASTFPQKIESQWYLYWMQSIPGFNNQIPYNTNEITNWWEFVFDWDEGIMSGLGLYQPVLPLPVNLGFFVANQKAKASIELQWLTHSETNNDYFIIERSNDGILFSNIGKVSGDTNSQSDKQYTFLDKDPHFGINYYRLKQVDIDGSHEYSKVISIAFEIRNPKVIIYPNPTDEFIHISGLKSELQEVSIINSLGKVVLRTKLNGNVLDLSSLTAGIYVISFWDGKKRISESVYVR